MLNRISERFPIATDVAICVIGLISCMFFGWLFFAIKEFAGNISEWYWLLLLGLARALVFLTGLWAVFITSVLIYWLCVELHTEHELRILREETLKWEKQHQEDMKRIVHLANNWREYYEQ